MANTKPDELQHIIDTFSKPGAPASEVRPAILLLARRLKALEDQAKAAAPPKP